MSHNNKYLLALVIAVAATAAVDANARKPAPAKAAAAAPEVVAVDVAPPSGSWEAKPAPANGHIWSSGYYEWKDARYAWKAGEWVLAREGMEYRQHQWTQRADGKWIVTGGDWVTPKDSVAEKK